MKFFASLAGDIWSIPYLLVNLSQFTCWLLLVWVDADFSDGRRKNGHRRSLSRGDAVAKIAPAGLRPLKPMGLRRGKPSPGKRRLSAALEVL
ncbi:MAG TPA: hypothetical protein VN823_13420 [Stellaceae bacterium]|nr:hypothetical protein [Stellaceae bacterium]